MSGMYRRSINYILMGRYTTYYSNNSDDIYILGFESPVCHRPTFSSRVNHFLQVF